MEKKELTPIEITVSYEMGFPVIETISVQEQKEWLASGGTIQELIDWYLESYRSDNYIL